MAGVTSSNVEYYYDPESRNWGFRVDKPPVIGGGDRTRAAAERHAARAIAFALKGEEADRKAQRPRTQATRTRRDG